MKLTKSTTYVTFSYLNGLTANFVRVPREDEERVGKLVNQSKDLKTQYTDGDVTYTPKEVLRAGRKSRGRKLALRLNEPGNNLDESIRTLKDNRLTLNQIRAVDRYEQQRRGGHSNLPKVSDTKYKTALRSLQGGEGIASAQKVRDAMSSIDSMRRGANPQTYEMSKTRTLLKQNPQVQSAIQQATNGNPITAKIPSYIDSSSLPDSLTNNTGRGLTVSYNPAIPESGAKTGTSRAVDRVTRVLSDIGVEQNATARPTTARLRGVQLKEFIRERAQNDPQLARENLGKLKTTAGRFLERLSNPKPISPETDSPPITEPDLPTPTPKPPSAPKPQTPTDSGIPNSPDELFKLQTDKYPSKKKRGRKPKSESNPTPEVVSQPPVENVSKSTPVVDTPAPAPRFEPINPIVSKQDELSGLLKEVKSVRQSPVIPKATPHIPTTMGGKGLVGLAALGGGLGLLGGASMLANNNRAKQESRLNSAQQGYLNYPGYAPYPQYSASNKRLLDLGDNINNNKRMT
jgi:hypothetical protein